MQKAIEVLRSKGHDISDEEAEGVSIAILLHDIGHGPMSHQFDSFMMSKKEFKEHFKEKYEDLYPLIKDDSNLEHEHISVVFIKKIFEDLNIGSAIDVENVIKIIEFKYKDKKIDISTNGKTYDILPLFTSIISSCPIDADRMDYLLRDSFFSGVKCGVYNYDRLLMSIIPVIDNNKIYLAYKESGIDSIVEFINARGNL